ncbi:methionine/alanine import family NSS transporter small subunit [Alkanindiges hydrocarboniclasticus]|jgi:hypothetical protein|nr:methionine/alanine import family NSS transporter small subunit [Alkanindiges hydrocarboniclasticus]
MNGSALVMMVLSIVLLWGGLLVAAIHLSRHPDE